MSDKSRLQVSVDGGLTYQDADEARVIFYGLGAVNEDGDIDLHITLTQEGIISDVVHQGSGAVLETESETAQELVDRLMDRGNS